MIKKSMNDQNSLKKSIADQKILKSHNASNGNDTFKGYIYELGVVNLHFTNKCNNSCRFCYGNSFDSIKNEGLSTDDWKKIILLLSPYCTRINFAGGEPLLHKRMLKDLLNYNNEIGITSTLITNGDYLDASWLEECGHLIAAIGISCDSKDEKIQSTLGRGLGRHVNNTLERFSLIKDYNSRGGKILMKLNTVVTSLNYDEDMRDFVLSTGVKRWKCFQLLEIVGENAEEYKKLKINETQFKRFVDLNGSISDQHLKVVFENRFEMIDTYVMINPEGRFFSNNGNIYKKSDPILSVGVEKALSQINFDQKNLEGIDRLFI